MNSLRVFAKLTKFLGIQQKIDILQPCISDQVFRSSNEGDGANEIIQK